MKRKLKRTLAYLLCVCMVAMLLPLSTLAAVGASDAPTITGYTRYTATQLDPELSYLVVTQDSAGNVYALYASEAGAAVSSGALTGTPGACTALLAHTATPPTAVYLADGTTPIDLAALAFTPAAVDGGHSLSANGYYLALGGTMFTTDPATLSVSGLNGRYSIASSERVLNFNRNGDSASAYSGHITDFWGPKSGNHFPIYLYVEGEWEAPVEPEPEMAAGKPADGVTSAQPFAPGTAGSANFRIPALVTLSDGTLVAAADARWNHSGDACALDTIVSRSTDNGATWSYTFANYFNDSTDARHSYSTAFIDPLMVADHSDNLYLLVDLFPGGIGLNTAPAKPAASTGYTDIEGTQRLMLFTSTSGQSDSTYTHYVGDFAEGYAPVYARDTSDTAVCYVDEWYYLYDTSMEPLICPQLGSTEYVHQNVFFYNADLHVRSATFLWLVKSEDGGATWSAPSILNPQIRKTEGTNQFYGVGPGAGLCLEDGTIILPCYTFTAEQPSSAQIASFIYSSDGGATWHRSDDATTDWSSESALVQLDETTVRHFYRDGHATLRYTDHTLAGNTWVAGSSVNTGVTKTSNNQLAAIKYSKTIDGKTAILVSTAASGTTSRTNGRIYTFLLDDDHNMTLAYTFNVTDGAYGYSSLTELENGSIGLLYESSGAVIDYFNYSITEITDGGIIDGKRTVTVPLYGTRIETVSGAGPSAEELAAADPSIVTIATETTTTTMATRGSDATYSGSTVPLSDALYTFTGNNTSGFSVSTTTANGTIYLDPSQPVGYPQTTETGATITLGTGSAANSFYLLDSDGNYLHFYRNGNNRFDRVNTTTGYEAACSFLLYRPAADGETGSTEIPGYVQVTQLDAIASGTAYLIVAEYNNSYYVLYPSTSTDNRFDHAAKVGSVDTATRITYTGLRDGQTSYTSGGVTTTIQVAAQNLTSVDLTVGGTASIPVAVDTITMDSDPAIATATIEIDDRSFSVTGGQGNLGTNASYTGAQVPLSNALYCFDGDNENGFTVSARMADGTVVYLKPAYGGSAGYPSTTVEGVNILSAGYLENSFYIRNDANRFLHFHRNGNNIFDRVTTTATFEDGCSFLIYRPVTDGETSGTQLPGYVQVTDLANIQDGGYYLIVAEYSGSYFALYPSNSTTSKYAHVVKVDPSADVVTASVTLIDHYLTITGVTVGTTDLIVDGMIYRVNVTPAPVAPVLPPDTVPSTTPGGTAEIEEPDVPQTEEPGLPFTDVEEGKWFYDAVKFVVEQGLFNGTSDTTFAPTVGMDRAMLATVLHRLAGLPAADGSAGFTDVESGKWYSDAIDWAAANGVVTGYGEDAFGPTDLVTREQMVTMLYRLAVLLEYDVSVSEDTDLSTFNDADAISDWAAQAMEWAVSIGLIQGDNGSLMPDGTAIRAQVATILMRFCQHYAG